MVLGTFADFATLTLEEAENDLLHEFGGENQELDPGDVIAEYYGTKVAGVLRISRKTTPGRRVMRWANTILILPRKGLSLDASNSVDPSL